MIRALKDYNETVCKPAWGWMKRHWKGYAFYTVCCVVIPYVWWYWSDICDYFKSKFNKTSEEES